MKPLSENVLSDSGFTIANYTVKTTKLQHLDGQIHPNNLSYGALSVTIRKYTFTQCSSKRGCIIRQTNVTDTTNSDP